MKVFDVPRVAHACPIFLLEPVGPWDDYAANDEGAFPWGGEFVGAHGGPNASEHQIADVDITFAGVPIMISP